MDGTLNELIKIVKTDSSKALGCTEPVAVAYCANVAANEIDKEKIKKVEIIVSKSIYKNGKFVKIPKTGKFGLDLAAALGIVVDKCDDGFMIFSDVDENSIKSAEKLLQEKEFSVKFKQDTESVYVDIKIETENGNSEAIIKHAHTNIYEIQKNGEIIYKQEEKEVEEKRDAEFDIKKLSFKALKDIIDEAPYEKIAFVLEGIEINKEAAEEGLKGRGSSLGKTLNELKEKEVLPDNFVTEARIMTAAAADMRMGGGKCPIMTSGGSGNQGIGVILPIAITAEEEQVDEERLAKAIFFAHCINRYVKEYSGKLSGICGCAIGAAIGSAAGITWMLGGTDEQIAGACTNIYANLTGMICDGAKESCAMKLSTTAEESIIAAYLSLNGVISDKNVGIVGDTIEETIQNIGKLSHGAFTKVDDLMLEILDK